MHAPVGGRALGFGEFLLVPGEKRLLFQGKAVPLPPKVFDTLLLLVERPGSLFEKDDLLKRLWPDTFVEEVALAHNVSALRKAFRSLGVEEELIETVPRRGYRFVMPVREVSLEPTSLAVPLRSEPESIFHPPVLPTLQRWRQRVWLTAAVAAAMLVGGIGIWRLMPRPSPAPSSIGILPFAVAANDDAVAHLGAGLADALIVRLHHLRRVVVRPMSAVASFDPESQDAVAFGRSLHVDTVLAGRVQHDGARLRVNATLIRTADSTVVWAAEFDEPPVNLLSVEDSIANRIVDSLSPSLSIEEHRLVARRGTSVAAAHDAYLRGRYLWTRRSLDNLRKALEFQLQAVRLDPEYALAWAGLADAYTLLDGYTERSNDEMLPPARSAAAKAMALDPTLAQPHATLGLIAMNIDWNWSEAERQFRQAIVLDPSYATAHAWLGEFLAYMGRFDEGIAELRRAHELDPLSSAIGSDVGKALTLARRYSEALAQLNDMIDRDPRFDRNYAYRCTVYYLLGRYDDALADLKRAHIDPSDAVGLSARIQINGTAGRSSEVESDLKRLEEIAATTFVTPVYLALAYETVGDADRMFEYIDRMIDGHGGGVISLKVDPAWDAYRHDPRFDRALRRVGFPR